MSVAAERQAKTAKARSGITIAGRNMSGNAVREGILGWLFASPWIIGFIVFTLIPMVFSFYTSFTQYNLLTAPKWVGFENYETIFQDRYFWLSLQNTFWLVFFKVPIVMITAISIALLLNYDLPGERLFRTIIYLPNVLAGAAAIFLWQWILAPNGLFNNFLGIFGIRGPSWFTDADWTKPGLIVMGMWWIGGNIIIYLAALKGIPTTLYEAAAIDGAVGWSKIRYITLPLLSPAIFFQVITSIIGTFQIFATVYIITNTAGGSGTNPALGGPEGSLMFYVLYIYNRAFGRIGQGGLQMGYASALAWILFAIILVITMIQLYLSKRWVHYDS
jgi:multiple sugar transport system permease protein